MPIPPPLTLPVPHCSTFHIMCAVPSTAVYCSESIERSTVMASKSFFKPFVTNPVAQVITAIIIHFTFHARRLSLLWLLLLLLLLLLFLIRPHYGPGVDSASNRNVYQEYFLGGKGGRWVGLTTLPLSCADCLQIWEPQPPGTLRASPGL